MNLDFQPYKYGPFSQKIYEIVETLESEKLVLLVSVKLNEKSNDAKLITILEEGKIKGKIVYESMTDKERESLDDIVKRWGIEPLSSLLVYTYLTYPESTKNSIIKDEVLS